MTPDAAPAAASRTHHGWAWVLAGVAALLLLASLTGNGTGMYGTGLFMGLMWLWMILPLLLVALLAILVLDRRARP